MVKRHPVAVQRTAFLFCRVSITVILWTAFLLHAVWALWLAFFLLACSAALGVRRAPMIVFYETTFGRFVPSPAETLDEPSMRFAHTLGASCSALCLLLTYTAPAPVAWATVFLLAVLKTVSALGYCPASKLYVCATGGCCPLSRRLFGTPGHG